MSRIDLIIVFKSFEYHSVPITRDKKSVIHMMSSTLKF
jgi:hypothetical protein